MTPPIHHSVGRFSAFRALARLRALLGRVRRADLDDVSVAGVLDLFEEHFYVGEITADGRYVALTASPVVERFFGGPVPPGAEAGALWESLVHQDDWPDYLRFNRRLLEGEDADATYRVTGFDGVRGPSGTAPAPSAALTAACA